MLRTASIASRRRRKVQVFQVRKHLMVIYMTRSLTIRKNLLLRKKLV